MDKDFSYTSSSQRDEIEAIRNKYLYLEYGETNLMLKELRDIETKVINSATIVGIIYGVLGSLFLGYGLTLVLTSDKYLLGILIGVVGILGIGLVLPMFRRTLKKQRKKYSSRVIELTDELLQEKKEK